MENMADRHGLKNLIEYISVILLSVAMLASSWCAAQSSLWTSLQVVQYADANEMGRLVLEKSTREGVLRSVDVQVFTQYANALVTGKTDLARFYFNRFRPEAKPALEAWLKTDPLNNTSAPANPFLMPEYKLAIDDELVQLRLKAERIRRSADESNATSDRYVLLIVLFAAVLFLTGLTPKFSRLRAQLAVLFFAGAIAIGCFVIMFIFPIATTPLLSSY